MSEDVALHVVTSMPRKQTPPKKKAEKKTGRRTIDGLALDIVTGAMLMGDSEHTLRAQVARREIPFRRRGGRIIFIRSELEEFLLRLPGVRLEEALANAARPGHGGAG